jgi:hypothetical protein
MEIVFGFFVIVSFFVAYFLPALIAHVREHNNTLAIFVLNLLLGWSFFGWVVALVWAFTNNKR